MYWNSSGHWQRRRHGGNGWVIALVIVGLIILTHGWILLVPLFVLGMAVAAFAFFGFVLPKLMMHAQHHGGWQRGDWHHGDWKRGDWSFGDWSCKGEKRKNDSWGWERAPFGEKQKRDDIDYV